MTPLPPPRDHATLEDPSGAPLDILEHVEAYRLFSRLGLLRKCWTCSGYSMSPRMTAINNVAMSNPFMAGRITPGWTIQGPDRAYRAVAVDQPKRCLMMDRFEKAETVRRKMDALREFDWTEEEIARGLEAEVESKREAPAL